MDHIFFIKQTQINYICIYYSYVDVSREFHQSMKIVKKKKFWKKKKLYLPSLIILTSFNDHEKPIRKVQLLKQNTTNSVNSTIKMTS